MVSLKTKLYQMFILGVNDVDISTKPSEVLLSKECRAALNNGLGGVIFFTKDILNPIQFKNLIEDVKSESLIYPFLSIDQEGGRVERTENIHKGKKYLSPKYAFEKGEDFLINQTKEIASELRSYGINLNFAPCIDVNTNPNNPIIGERSFSSDPDEVIKCEKIVSEIYSELGIIPCVKHYPGHGDASADSHLTLPMIDLSLEEMERTHIKPFKSASEHTIPMIMAAHLHCTCFEKEPIPTSLSKNAISFLRNELGFNGVIISDDMIMKGVADFGQTQACIKGINAGLNMFIYRYSDEKIINVIEEVYDFAQKDEELQKKIENSYEKITELKRNFIK